MEPPDDGQTWKKSGVFYRKAVGYEQSWVPDSRTSASDMPSFGSPIWKKGTGMGWDGSRVLYTGYTGPPVQESRAPPQPRLRRQNAHIWLDPTHPMASHPLSSTALLALGRKAAGSGLTDMMVSDS